MKKILSIQDISCFGKCSQTAALPIISALGCECVPLPTALLSAHTAFDGYYLHDLSGEMMAVCEHWKKLGLKFDAIYTGYLATKEQIALVHRIIDDFGEGIPLFVDPVMADNGKLYSGFDESFICDMATLCRRADVIIPNITEACFLSGIEYKDENHEKSYVDSILSSVPAKACVLTGVCDDKGRISAVYSNKGIKKEFSCERIEHSYPGTGDVFASCLVGCAVRTGDIEKAIRTAVDFTYECIRATSSDDDYNYSVKFEECIPYLLEKVKR